MKGENMSARHMDIAVGTPQVRPIDIRAQLFAANGTISGALDSWAMVGGQPAFSVSPKAHRLSGHVQHGSDLCRPATQINCFLNRIHKENSTLVEIQKSTLVFLPSSTNV